MPETKDVLARIKKKVNAMQTRSGKPALDSAVYAMQVPKDAEKIKKLEAQVRGRAERAHKSKRSYKEQNEYEYQKAENEKRRSNAGEQAIQRLRKQEEYASRPVPYRKRLTARAKAQKLQ